MPVLDMPLSELKQYCGITPCPDDFDAFWDHSITELSRINPRASFTPYPFPSAVADCYELRFTSDKGATIYAKFATPKGAVGKCPTLLHFHGLGGRSLPWIDLTPYAAQGMCIASMDVRGQGGRSQDVGGYVGTTDIIPFMRGIEGEPEDLLYRSIFLDTAMLATVLKAHPLVDGTRMGVFGGSQGGALSLVCASLVPEIKLCSTRFPYLSDYRRVWEMDLAKGAYDGLGFYFRKFDPRHEREEEIFTKLGYIDIQNLVPRIRAKVKFYTGLMDNICPPSTQFAAYNKITSQKELIVYPDYGHEELPDEKDMTFSFFAEQL